MEDSILKTTKKVVGLVDDDDSFNDELLVLINGAFSTLAQLGVNAPESGIEDATATWSSLNLSPEILGAVRAYVPLSVQMGWDPPTLSFLIEMKEKQIAQYEWRIVSLVEMEAQ